MYSVEFRDWIAQRCGGPPSDAGILARAWATVDLERSMRDSGHPDPVDWEPVKDELLGARGWRLRGGEPVILLLEPATEGRLAGWLARHGEGEAAVYQAVAGPEIPGAKPTALGAPGVVVAASGPALEVRVSTTRSPNAGLHRG